MDDIRSNLTINGAVPLTVRDHELMKADFSKQLNDGLLRIEHTLRGSSERTEMRRTGDGGAVDGEDPRGPQEWWRRWDWGDGQISHPVPKYFVLPKGLSIRCI